ncbi:MAG TPA: preprotein translocase subunit SecG [Deltaproteobacteria bacterium]|jgi:preprotein translocase subunit SecG|uniref:Protein-export membrane protein SecG n=1 Tax=SAR324 cluster bacterium TaxID=2024889 RepID=A0A432GPY3_9DELT|nr:preprotein translocase subunit SecG [SAR324 cluster bacterium]HBD28140.1 preprotein translocase subunit SecG [Deltaproteobacteria bacterium]MCH2267261.1 preprotein translocase subunit SecG [SAR324 cluster bacterium]RTZ85567.1 MAG: preprotein translocase subunit SecG [SAR324 cluster bacterium]RTZ85764.1 MAG: preprotein translocase subunit SecG [SAR324 cluster bacterium]
MFELILVIHIIACISIIFFVLLQSGRGAELGAAFGSVGQANSVRGSMTGVGKITTGVAIVFMLTSLSLAYLSSDTARDSVVRDLAPVTTTIPVAEQMLIPDEDTQAEKTPEIPPAELEQKVAPPIESSSGN